MATYKPLSLGGDTTFSFLFNYTDTEVTEFNRDVLDTSGFVNCRKRFPECAGTSRRIMVSADGVYSAA